MATWILATAVALSDVQSLRIPHASTRTDRLPELQRAAQRREPAAASLPSSGLLLASRGAAPPLRVAGKAPRVSVASWFGPCAVLAAALTARVGRTATPPRACDGRKQACGGRTEACNGRRSTATTTRSSRTACIAMAAREVEALEDAALFESLQKRRAAIDGGAGKRYRVDSLVGFLNVHSEPGNAFRTDNVVSRLWNGAVVESVAEDGLWVSHDGGGIGGWSIREHDGHEYLARLGS